MIIHLYNFFILNMFFLIKKRKIQKRLIIFFLILLSVLDGIRYNCYFDYESYKDHYYKLKSGFIFENGYENFVDIFRIFNSYNFMLFIIAVLIYYFIFYKNYKILDNNLLYIYISFTQIIPFMGVNRQLLSIVLLCIGIRYLIINNKILKFILFCLFAGMFHITALTVMFIGIIYYFLGKYIWKNKIFITLIIVMISQIFIFYDINKILKLFLSICPFFEKFDIYLINNAMYKMSILNYLIRNAELFFPLIYLYFLDKKNKKGLNLLENRVIVLSLLGILAYYFIYFVFYGKFQILISRLGLTLRGIFLPMYYTSTYNLIDNKKIKKIFLILTLFIFGVFF